MYSFKDDYSEGAHPRILEALIQTNLQQMKGYGEDEYTREAIELIQKKAQAQGCRCSSSFRRNPN